MLANILIAQLVDLAQQGRASQMSILRFEHIETPKYFEKKEWLNAVRVLLRTISISK